MVQRKLEAIDVDEDLKTIELMVDVCKCESSAQLFSETHASVGRNDRFKGHGVAGEARGSRQAVDGSAWKGAGEAILRPLSLFPHPQPSNRP